MQELFQIIQNSSDSSVCQSPIQIIVNLSLAMFLGLIYAYVYKLTYINNGKNKLSKKSYKTEMLQVQFTLVFLSIGGAFIWIVIADNLVRAFGLAGALSLIRFRTVVKDHSNTIKLFYAIIIGMSCGLSQFYAASIGTAFICMALTIVYLIKKSSKRKNKISSDINEK